MEIPDCLAGDDFPSVVTCGYQAVTFYVEQSQHLAPLAQVFCLMSAVAARRPYSVALFVHPDVGPSLGYCSNSPVVPASMTRQRTREHL